MIPLINNGPRNIVVSIHTTTINSISHFFRINRHIVATAHYLLLSVVVGRSLFALLKILFLCLFACWSIGDISSVPFLKKPFSLFNSWWYRVYRLPSWLKNWGLGRVLLGSFSAGRPGEWMRVWEEPYGGLRWKTHLDPSNPYRIYWDASRLCWLPEIKSFLLMYQQRKGSFHSQLKMRSFPPHVLTHPFVSFNPNLPCNLMKRNKLPLAR